MFQEAFDKIKETAYNDLTLFGLKSLIILWCFVIVGLVLLIDNKWVLAGILAYEVLP
jgi:hypothetical protein